MYGEHLPHFNPHKVVTKPVNPIYNSLFEIQFNSVTTEKLLSNLLTNNVKSYQILSPEQSTKKLLRVDFCVNEETFIQLQNQLKYVERIEIYHHDRHGKNIYMIDSQKIRIDRILVNGDYQSQELQVLSVYWEYIELNWKAGTLIKE